MKFVSFSNLPISREVTFETKSHATGVGFVTLGQRIRGLLTNNKLDLSGVRFNEDYDDDAKDGKWIDDDKLNYDETQEFMDKLDVADKVETISSRLEESIEEQVSNAKATSKENKKSVSSELGSTQTKSEITE